MVEVYPWAELDELVSHFNASFQSFVVDILTSEALFTTFSEIVASNMPLAEGAGRLRLVRTANEQPTIFDYCWGAESEGAGAGGAIEE